MLMLKLKRNGFTMIEALFGLLTTGIVAFLCMILMQCYITFIYLDLNKQNQFAILQLRQVLSVAESMKVKNNSLTCILNHEEFEFYYDRNRLVASPGYEIWMENIDEAYFTKENDSFYLFYRKNNKMYKYEIS